MDITSASSSREAARRSSNVSHSSTGVSQVTSPMDGAISRSQGITVGKLITMWVLKLTFEAWKSLHFLFFVLMSSLHYDFLSVRNYFISFVNKNFIYQSLISHSQLEISRQARICRHIKLTFFNIGVINWELFSPQLLFLLSTAVLLTLIFSHLH